MPTAPCFFDQREEALSGQDDRKRGCASLEARAMPKIVVYLLAGLLLILPAQAQEAFPSKPVRIVVPFPAGGTADTLPRIIAEVLRETWRQPVVVENRAGAAGNIGAEQVARAAPDGYTLLAAPPPPLAINRHLYKQLGYDATRFVPITVLAAVPNVLVAGPKLTAGSVAELVAQAKAAPERITYASQGSGSTSHLAACLFESMAGIRLLHVPYKGTAPALLDLIGGHVDFMFDNIASSLPQHRAGKLRILAVAGPARAALLPEAPTVAELGYAGFQSVAWFALVAPPETPPAIIAAIHAAVADVLRKPTIRARLLELGAEPVGDTPAATAQFIAAESARWQQVIATANVMLE
jgi:tripartite-type tricarboxylate transporter receptor subunit TctC